MKLTFWKTRATLTAVRGSSLQNTQQIYNYFSGVGKKPHGTLWVPPSKTHSRCTTSWIGEQPLRYFVGPTFKNTQQMYNFWDWRATLTALCESQLQKHIANVPLIESENTPYDTSCVPTSKTHWTFTISGIGVRPLRHFVSPTFENTPQILELLELGSNPYATSWAPLSKTYGKSWAYRA